MILDRYFLRKLQIPKPFLFPKFSKGEVNISGGLYIVENHLKVPLKLFLQKPENTYFSSYLKSEKSVSEEIPEGHPINATIQWHQA